MHACGLKDKSVIVCLCDGHCVGRSESGAVAQPSAAGPPVASLGSPEIERPRDALARRRGDLLGARALHALPRPLEGIVRRRQLPQLRAERVDVARRWKVQFSPRGRTRLEHVAVVSVNCYWVCANQETMINVNDRDGVCVPTLPANAAPSGEGRSQHVFVYNVSSVSFAGVPWRYVSSVSFAVPTAVHLHIPRRPPHKSV